MAFGEPPGPVATDAIGFGEPPGPPVAAVIASGHPPGPIPPFATDVPYSGAETRHE